MKTINLFECEICGSKYDNEKEALKCEARGFAVEYPIGCIYGNNEKGSFYEHITFAVATNRYDRWNKHLNVGSSWACRDLEGIGDSLGEEKCCGSSLTLYENEGNIDRESPSFKRMVEWLKSQNIPITIWDGEKAIPYESS